MSLDKAIAHGKELRKVIMPFLSYMWFSDVKVRIVSFVFKKLQYYKNND